jgi:hypothetical protein
MSLGKNVSWTKHWNVRVKTSPGHSMGGRTVRALKEDDRLEEIDTIHGGIVVSSSDSTSVDIKSLREEEDDDIPTMSQGPVILGGMVKTWFIVATNGFLFFGADLWALGHSCIPFSSYDNFIDSLLSL